MNGERRLQAICKPDGESRFFLEVKVSQKPLRRDLTRLSLLNGQLQEFLAEPYVWLLFGKKVAGKIDHHKKG